MSVGDKYFEHANRLFKKGEWIEAIKEYENIIRLDEKYIGAYINMGLCYSLLGDIPASRSLYIQAIRVDPENFISYYNLGLSYFDNKEYENAAIELSYSSKLAPNNYNSCKILGTSYALIDKFHKAYQTSFRLLLLKPFSIDSYITGLKIFSICFFRASSNYFRPSNRK